MTKKENESVGLFVAGIILIGLHYFFESKITNLLYFGLTAMGIGLITFIYPLISKRKRFSKAELATIDQFSGTDFEEYVVFLLTKHNFEKIKLTPPSGDQGIDVIATKDGVKYGIQCKRWKKKVGNKAIQEVYAGIGYYSLDKAVVLTNSYFTDSAKQLSKKLQVELWDRTLLIKLIESTVEKDQDSKVPTE